MRWRLLAISVLVTLIGGCSTNNGQPGYNDPTSASDEYVIGPGDQLKINVRENRDLSVSLPVRPDGLISIPLVRDVQAAGRTTSELADKLEMKLSDYIREPIVTVMVTDSVGTYADRIRVIGQAAQPQALAYRKGMTVLDALIQVGGLTEFAAGNDAKLVRREGNESHKIRLRLDDLLNNGDLSQNRRLRPGDVLVIPESLF